MATTKQKKSSMWYRFIAFVFFSDGWLEHSRSLRLSQPKPTGSSFGTSAGLSATFFDNGTAAFTSSHRQPASVVDRFIIFGRHKHTSAFIQGRGPNLKKE
jgi:hypothetical protein